MFALRMRGESVRAYGPLCLNPDADSLGLQHTLFVQPHLVDSKHGRLYWDPGLLSPCDSCCNSHQIFRLVIAVPVEKILADYMHHVTGEIRDNARAPQGPCFSQDSTDRVSMRDWHIVAFPHHQINLDSS